MTSVEFEVRGLSGLEMGISQLSFVYLVAEAMGVDEITSRG